MGIPYILENWTSNPKIFTNIPLWGMYSSQLIRYDANISSLIVFLLVALVICKQKKVFNDIVINIGESTKFSTDEINNAVECVKNNFSFPSSTLIRICYDEEKSNYLIDDYMKYGRGSENRVIEENVIIILSNFDVDGSGDNPVLNSNSTYTDYQWILIRDDETSDWKIDDSGY